MIHRRDSEEAVVQGELINVQLISPLATGWRELRLIHWELSGVVFFKKRTFCCWLSVIALVVVKG